MYQKCLLISLIFLILNGKLVQSSLKEKIYFTLNNNEYHMCFKRLNETHQIGCGSKRNGNVGILRLLESDDDMNWLRSRKNMDEYIVLMKMEYFNETIMTELITLMKITGVLVEKSNSSRPQNFSPDMKIPNQEFGIYNSSSFEWNVFGNGLLFLDIPFPVALLLNETTIEFLRECYYKHNEGSKSTCPWCAVRMKSFMFAAVDSVVCHRRSHMHNNLNPEEYCDPIGSYNVISSVGPWIANKPVDGSVILVIARLDALSMFDGLSPGFDSAMTGFVALQAVSQIIGRMKRELEPYLEEKPVMFALFQGESLGYMGSSRFIHDMFHGEIKQLNVTSIGTIIELGQLGVHRYTSLRNKAWVHFDKDINDVAKDKLNQVVNSLTDAMNLTNKVQLIKANRKLPPSSIQSFLKYNPYIAGVVISNHENEFSNRFYNGFLDDHENVDVFSNSNDSVSPTVAYVGDIAERVACAIRRFVTNSSGCETIPPADHNYIKELFSCFGEDGECEQLNSTVFEDDDLNKAKQYIINRYTGVFGDVRKQFPTIAHRALMIRNIGDVVDMSFCDMQDLSVYNGTRCFKFRGFLDAEGQRNPICYRAHVILNEALSPIFDKDELWINSGYSSWTESRWVSFGIDVFLLPCYIQELKTILLGVAVILVMLPIIIFTNHKLLREDMTSGM